MMRCDCVLTCILFTGVIESAHSYSVVGGNLQSERRTYVKNKSHCERRKWLENITCKHIPWPSARLRSRPGFVAMLSLCVFARRLDIGGALRKLGNDHRSICGMLKSRELAGSEARRDRRTYLTSVGHVAGVVVACTNLQRECVVGL
jgi:hypothetical protein